MSELLRKQYESVFSIPKEEYAIKDISQFFKINEVVQQNSGKTLLTDIDFSMEDVKNAISKIKNHAAAGPDSWPAILLKNCKDELSLPIFTLWKSSLDSGIIPATLKKANIVPIYKGGKKCLAKNYRPVALTSHLIKLFETIIKNSIFKYIDENNLFNENQHGFRSGRSCLSQLLEHYEDILNTLEKGQNYDVVYTDFAKAFDKCDHGLIAHKLKNLGITGKIGRWIYNFLVQREQRVVLQGMPSQDSKVISSVPQGTVLAPLLFIILLSDIDEDTSSKVSSFADDTKVSKSISTSNDIKVLQEDIKKLCQWTNKNNMLFNSEKFQLMRYGKHEHLKQNDYILPDKTKIKPTHEAKDLGVLMNDDCKFEAQTNITVNKAKRTMGLILRTFRRRDKKVMIPLLKTLIIPKLEYCSVLTNPIKKSEISKIEGIQRSFTAKIDGMENLDYWERLLALNLYSLERRRERYIIIYVWKILEGQVPNLKINKIIASGNAETRRGRVCKIPKLKKKHEVQYLY